MVGNTFIQMTLQFIESVLLQPNLHMQHVVRWRSALRAPFPRNLVDFLDLVCGACLDRSRQRSLSSNRYREQTGKVQHDDGQLMPTIRDCLIEREQ